MTLQAVVEWVFAPLIASIRREAYQAGREDALEDVRETLKWRKCTNPPREKVCGLREPEVN